MFAEQIEKHFIPQMRKVFTQYDEIESQEHIASEQSLASVDTDSSVMTTGEYEASLSQPTVSISKITTISEKDSQ